MGKFEQSKGRKIKMGGGSHWWMGAQGIVAAGTLYNPDYGKMAADSLAKELEERKLVPPTTSAQAAQPGQDQVPPSTTADEITPRKDEGPGGS
jgi:hypothetical protein